MNFNQLDSKTQEQLHKEVSQNAEDLGGKNFFLQVIDDVKKEKIHPLLNKSGGYHFSKGKITWTKSIYKDTLDLLHETIKKEEADSKYFEGLKPKLKKTTINMMKTLKPVSIKIKPKQRDDGSGFELNIIDASNEDDIKISMMYKIIFFYSADFAKQALNYKPEN